VDLHICNGEGVRFAFKVLDQADRGRHGSPACWRSVWNKFNPDSAIILDSSCPLRFLVFRKLQTTSRGSVNVWIALEGMDGTGKSTVAEELKKRFTHAGRNVQIVADPGGWSMGALFRDVILEKREWEPCGGPFEGWHPLARRLLLAADFTQVYHEQILPSLNNGDVVIGDRLGYISGRIYGMADGIPRKIIDQVMDIITPPRKPDYIFVLVASDEVLRERLSRRGKADFYDRKPSEYKQKIRDGYARATKAFSGKEIPAHLPVERVVDLILHHINWSDKYE